jgi:hypothetical protein
MILSCSALLALLYPLVLWQKEWFFSTVLVTDGLASCFWIAQPLLLTLVCFALAAGMRQKTFCYACIIAASFFLAFASAEIYFKLLNINYVKREYLSADSIYVKSGQAAHLLEADGSSPDPVLGHGPNPNGITRLAARLVRGGEVIYDALYSRDEEGRRITPDRGGKADTAILLFGCSYTMGHGLHDRETFAWQLGEMLGETFQVLNYGYDGYGAHQMLALVESGRLDALARRYTRIYALYLTTAVHEMRCVGVWPWNYPGPRYILENGALRHAGTLNERPELTRFLSRSQVYVRVKRAYHRHLAPYSALDTHVAIIAQAMRELHTRYNAHFVTAVWPDFTQVEAMLQSHGVGILPLSGAMPEYSPEKYTIKGDGHPNALANTRVAEALANYLLRHTQAAGDRQ